jgi:hypothetical protein
MREILIACGRAGTMWGASSCETSGGRARQSGSASPRAWIAGSVGGVSPARRVVEQRIASVGGVGEAGRVGIERFAPVGGVDEAASVGKERIEPDGGVLVPGRVFF